MVISVIFALNEDGAAAKEAERFAIAEYLGAGGRITPVAKHGGVSDETIVEMRRI